MGCEDGGRGLLRFGAQLARGAGLSGTKDLRREGLQRRRGGLGGRERRGGQLQGTVGVQMGEAVWLCRGLACHRAGLAGVGLLACVGFVAAALGMVARPAKWATRMGKGVGGWAGIAETLKQTSYVAGVLCNDRGSFLQFAATPRCHGPAIRRPALPVCNCHEPGRLDNAGLSGQ